MRLTQPLDNILNSEAKIRILRVLCKTKQDLSGRQIAKAIGVSPKTAHEVLQRLLKEGLLLMRRTGNTHLFRLDENREIVKGMLRPLFVEEEDLKDRLLKTIVESVKKSS